MSDISIPGSNSNADIQRMIEQLMEIERAPRVRAQERVDDLLGQKSAWQDLNRRMISLREASKQLFSFQNPFNTRVATSSDESALTATASREAAEETIDFTVKQLALADRFMSAPLSEAYQVPAGHYSFAVGEEQLVFDYRGGSLRDFSDSINRRNSGLIRAQVVPVTSTERILVIEALRTGSEARLGFADAAESLALAAGLIEAASASRQDLAANQPVAFSRPVDPALTLYQDGALQVKAGAEAAIRVAAAVPSANLMLELEILVQERPAAPSSSAPPGPGIPATGSVTYEDITIQSAPSSAILPDWTPPLPPPRRQDNQILYALDGNGRSVALPETRPSAEYQTIQVPLALFLDNFAGLGIRNNNTHHDVSIRSVRVYDPTETSGFRPLNAASTARDAIVVMEGIEVTRPTNSIDDLVPGVTLNLHVSSDKPVELTIEPDRETVKEAIIGLVGTYNRIMAEINVLSRNEDSVVDELSYLTEDEEATYRERLGMFQGDSTLSQMRGSMQRIMMNNYATRDGQSVLANFGISTNSQTGGGFDASRMRGYLEINEDQLMEALNSNFNLVRDVFGRDSDNDLIIDSGVAFMLDSLIKPYVETGGIMTLRTGTIDSMITRERATITSLDVSLARKEAELKRRYGLMESALNQMESSSSAWDNFSNQQGND
ncbi:MAG: hypothetical protein A2087_10410 [Spirochaetes bacterium GWD1_61_31]|nr:MAG: hypothetical protein A2Y37_12105 [Spirochaetes bacterium GWB1_60_80]OHD30121.1 MAG: hypothetical protein A2004_13965 [Spirochaetes bacterium GWC1_61_12]OHD34626.1 MAG: hypothetical protein A2087_10410 [Spirochaetes bacterium GWD1_61_31]OHD46442.1 MAG: hypothetical protein A2Y35_10315 [Spirochaetes bacterium GWE1_60_18]OHD59497.1 MAG: hypothetical protein A2Y32_10270 [Spirochaetes bacterium GWF1_60_12]HAW85807.1 flagellar hook protein [Spirochaetaceae bacterium]